MKKITILFVSLTLSVMACGSTEESLSLREALKKETTFEIDEDKFSALMTRATETCGRRGSSTGVATSDKALSALSIAVQIRINFENNRFKIIDAQGRTVLSGTWREMDEDTIRVTLQGIEVDLNVAVIGSLCDMNLPSETARSRCSSRSGSLPSSSPDPEVSHPGEAVGQESEIVPPSIDLEMPQPPTGAEPQQTPEESYEYPSAGGEPSTVPVP